MANTLISLINKRSLFNATLKFLPACSRQNVRTLYAPATLGIDGFLLQQQKTRNQMLNIADKFKEKMIEYSESEGTHNMVFTEDLKNMIHLSSDDSDIELVVRMIKKFNAQNKEVRFGNYVFGPVIMRLLHVNSKHELAYELFLAPELQGFFDQIISYQILMDLLYENGRYDEMIKVFDVVQDRQLEGMKYPKNAVVLVLAACYKLNTEQSLEYTTTLWKQLNETGHMPMRRATTFAAALAIRRNEPGIALEILSAARNQNYATVRNLRVAAFCALGRTEDVLPVLKEVLTRETFSDKIQTFNADVIEIVRQAVEKLEDPEVHAEFKRIEELLRKQHHVTDTTLEEQLCSDIMRPPVLQNRNQQYQPRYRSSFQQQGNKNFRYQHNRPGLKELL